MSCPPHFLSVFHVFSPQYYHSIHLLFMMILDGIQQQEQVDLEIDVDLLLFSVAKYQQYVPVRITYSTLGGKVSTCPR